MVMKRRVVHCGCLLLMIILALGTACSGGEGRLVNLTPGQRMDNCCPAWSPDGNQIVFLSGGIETSASGTTSSASATDFGVYVMDADGANRFRVAKMSSEYVSGVSWSPTGEIVFSTFQGGIVVMDLDGEYRYVIADADPPSAFMGLSQTPSYSPDGTKILLGKFLQDSAGSDGYAYRQILLVDADGTNLTKLSRDGANSDDPAWSPDGTRIAFSSDRDGLAEIYVMDADGSNVVRLTDDGYHDYCPVWSPDDERIAFTSDRDGKIEVYVMNSDGGNLVRLTHNSISELSLSWSPDGTELAIGGQNSSGNNSIYLLKMT